jgi:hypothetical protein
VIHIGQDLEHRLLPFSGGFAMPILKLRKPGICIRELKKAAEMRVREMHRIDESGYVLAILGVYVGGMKLRLSAEICAAEGLLRDRVDALLDCRQIGLVDAHGPKVVVRMDGVILRLVEVDELHDEKTSNKNFAAWTQASGFSDELRNAGVRSVHAVVLSEGPPVVHATFTREFAPFSPQMNATY